MAAEKKKKTAFENFIDIQGAETVNALKELHTFMTALMAAGFTEDQAIKIVSNVMITITLNIIDK